MALIAALFGVAACHAGLGAEQLPEGGGGSAGSGASGGTIDAGAGGSGASGGTSNDTDAANVAEASASDGSNDIDGATSTCGAIPDPNAWASWIMPNPAKSGLPNSASYTVSDSGNQVTDNVTGLVWQRNVDSSSYTWQDAKQHCACSTIDGLAGWRLPSRIELVSIADWTASGPSIDSNAFPSTPSVNFWSSSVLTNGDPTLGWLVFFDNGHTSYSDMGYTYRARCVRGQPSSTTAPSGRYTIAGGTVYDTQTKLTWQQMSSTSSYTWADATTYCSGLSLNGVGWRVPALGELQTIVDESTNPAIDAAAFPMTPSEYFWSSSAEVDDPSRAWTCFFANGSTYSFGVTTPRSVRCVR